jgi:hypothetical protein
MRLFSKKILEQILADKTIEQKVADTILQKKETVIVGDRTYTFEQPKASTVIEVSAAVSKMPRTELDDERVASEVLRVGKDCIPLGEIAALILCGTKGALSGGIRKFFFERKKKRMTAKILERHTPFELKEMVVLLLKKTDLASFFEVTTFLTEINLTKATKVETETTAPGQ